MYVVDSGSQVPLAVTGWPTLSGGNGSSGPITEASGSGAVRVRSRASATRDCCHASSCQTPSQPAAATQSRPTTCAPNRVGVK